MKRKFTLLSFLFFAIFLNVSAVPMSGTYTIGGTTPNFTSIQRAIDTLFARGVNGPVTFDIRPGTYNGQINIGNIPGVSATNTITIKSENNDSTSVILTDTASLSTGNFVFHVYGTDYLTVKNVTLYRIGNIANCTVINLATNSRYFRLIGCIVKNDYTGGANISQALVYWTSGSAADSLITFDGNVFTNGSYGIYMQGQSPVSNFVMTQITNNQFVNQYSRSVYMKYASSPVVNNNIISSTSGGGFNAIYLERILEGLDISKNEITGVMSGTGIYLDSVFGTTNTPGLISNNFIQTQGGTTSGISFNNANRINTYYNSINIPSTGTTSAGCRVVSTGCSSLNFANNILVSTGGGVTFYVSGNNAAAFSSSDYNDLYVAGNSFAIGYFDGGYDTTLANWQATIGADSNSVSTDPLFISVADLHAGSPGVNNAGTPLASVTTDIDGQSRSNTTPDIGADEFAPLANNVGAIRFLSPFNSTCGDSLTTISILIKNFGQSSQSGFNIVAEVTGAVNDTITQSFAGPIGSNLYDTLTFTTTLNTYAGGVVDIVAYTSLNTDQYHENDTIFGSFTFISHPVAPTVQSPQQVCDNNAQITGAPADTTEILVWYDQPSGGNLLFVGNTFNPPLTTDTTFYVESHSGGGSAGCLRFTEIQPEDNPSDYLEITNLSGSGFDATGWTVLASNDYTDITLVNPNVWNLGYFNPGEIRFRTDNGADTNYWGSNLLWANANNGWAMLIDSNNTVVDFIAWDWDSVTIANMAIFYNGDTLRPTGVWSGAGVPTCASSVNSLQRTGSDDHDNLSDWNCEPITPGTQNANLSSTFAHCGIGLCGSPRIPVSVILTAGATPVNLGPDTVVSNTDSLLLDAGTGYNSYLWSTGDTTQTIWAMQGSYWVMVTGGVNNCSYSDSININTPVGVNSLFANDEVSLYPNPANNKLMVSAKESIMKDAEFRITDIEGRVLQIRMPGTLNGQIEFDLSGLSNGFYYLQIISGNKSGTKKFTVIK